MPFKRKSRGRSKGSKGSSSLVQCVGCGSMVPRDKAKKSTRRVSFVEPKTKGAHVTEEDASRPDYYSFSLTNCKRAVLFAEP
jgi:ribosomal protein S26